MNKRQVPESRFGRLTVGYEGSCRPTYGITTLASERQVMSEADALDFI
jgi:hypothetical protein